MATNIIESGTLRATIYSPPQLYGKVVKKEEVAGNIHVPDIINYTSYYAGNGIVINEGYISIDELIIDCGRGTTV